MGAGPVDPPARRAGPECLVVAPDELGDQALDLGLVARLQDRVAAHAAAGRRRRGIQAQGHHHLAELLHHVIAFDEKMRGQQPTPEQTGVPGQEDAALAPGLAEEVVVLTGEVLRIVTQDAEPPGQPAEHRIGQEPRGLAAPRGLPRTALHESNFITLPGDL